MVQPIGGGVFDLGGEAGRCHPGGTCQPASPSQNGAQEVEAASAIVEGCVSAQAHEQTAIESRSEGPGSCHLSQAIEDGRETGMSPSSLFLLKSGKAVDERRAVVTSSMLAAVSDVFFTH